ncbi:hypothetical protein C492_19132 [Natronococcus jeotgali DSM 18795]|uniref:Uncharacterized protein n=1 Tax=Natronococcus jeotgali DSM 18795 TaxID=1227498 RepID=L9WTH2_9EURY|nr:hypothetical protein C492_19132 [Natronococcus jeotgali DSM 18795]
MERYCMIPGRRIQTGKQRPRELFKAAETVRFHITVPEVQHIHLNHCGMSHLIFQLMILNRMKWR